MLSKPLRRIFYSYSFSCLSGLRFLRYILLFHVLSRVKTSLQNQISVFSHTFFDPLLFSFPMFFHLTFLLVSKSFFIPSSLSLLRPHPLSEGRADGPLSSPLQTRCTEGGGSGSSRDGSGGFRTLQHYNFNCALRGRWLQGEAWNFKVPFFPHLLGQLGGGKVKWVGKAAVCSCG